tara:strand:- start:800 stop:1123 length:324 start_codon:yes stop_codon:yes gene_type:complete
MKTYEQGKAELDAEIKKLNNAIKDAKQNITFDFYCPQCNKTKKIRVHCANNGRKGKKYCGHNCRTKAYRKRREANEQAERQRLGLSELDYKIYKLKQKVTELENEKR